MKHLSSEEVARAAELLARQRRRPETAAFIGGSSSKDDLAEMLAEQTVEDATGGAQSAEETVVDEDFGGPFVETSARVQFGHGFDESNIPGAEPAAFPLAVAEEEDEEEANEEP